MDAAQAARDTVWEKYQAALDWSYYVRTHYVFTDEALEEAEKAEKELHEEYKEAFARANDLTELYNWIFWDYTGFTRAMVLDIASGLSRTKMEERSILWEAADRWEEYINWAKSPGAKDPQGWPPTDPYSVTWYHPFWVNNTQQGDTWVRETKLGQQWARDNLPITDSRHPDYTRRR